MSAFLPSAPVVGEPRQPVDDLARLRRRRIGEVMVAQGLVTERQLADALQQQQQAPPGAPRKRLGRIVVELGYATESQLAGALAEALGLDQVDLRMTPVDPGAARALPRAVAERSGIAVLGRSGRRLRVAVADPTNVVALDDVKFYTSSTELEIVVATESQVREQLARAWSLTEDSSGISTMLGSLDEPVEPAEADNAAAEVDDAPIVKLVDIVFADAVRARASDVHVEPQPDGLRIRYRVDGLLRDITTVPKAAVAALTSRIKIVSGLDIAERRRPQDGRAKLSVDGQQHDARVSTLPTLFGEKVVVRLLPTGRNVPELAQTGLDPRQLDALTTTLAAPQGLVLLTGPTGSGKTNTLYAAIRHASTPERNIVTLEDPIEVQFGGITQVQISDKAGLTFARGLRSVLRQDPDVVLVGEVRDTETARLALEASLTGHLVLTTLHTNDAVSAVTRLVDMGVEPFLVASSLSLVIAQRLVRRPCESCLTDYVPSEKTLSLLGLAAADLADATPRHGAGCPDCDRTGYRGRIGVFEVLPVTAALRSVLLSTPTEAAVGAAARSAGMQTLRASAITAARRGLTTYEEALRVTHVDAVGGQHCPSCARNLADDMIACPWCATVLNTGHCAGCARPLDPEWKLCPWCRTSSGSPAAD